MNPVEIEQALAAHETWVSGFRNQLIGNQLEALAPAEVADRNKCDLGQWLAEVGEYHGARPELMLIGQLHHAVHDAAAKVTACLGMPTRDKRLYQYLLDLEEASCLLSRELRALLAEVRSGQG